MGGSRDPATANQTILENPSDIQHTTNSAVVELSLCSMFYDFQLVFDFCVMIPILTKKIEHMVPTFATNFQSADDQQRRPGAFLCAIRGANPSIFQAFQRNPHSHRYLKPNLNIMPLPPRSAPRAVLLCSSCNHVPHNFLKEC